MSKKSVKTMRSEQLHFHSCSDDLIRCGFCGAARIDDYNDHRVVVIHTRTVDEFEAAVKKEAAQKDLNLSHHADRAFAEREVGWKHGHTHMETLDLCSKCFAKVRICDHCDYYACHEFEDKSVIHRCHFNHMTFCQYEPIFDPKTHFCGDWQQEEPFAEEDILELLRKDMP